MDLVISSESEDRNEKSDYRCLDSLRSLDMNVNLVVRHECEDDRTT